MTEYRMARPEEEDQLLDFINLVFSQVRVPHHFQRLLPKVYAHPGFSALHYTAVCDGRIAATVALLPLTLQMDADHALQGGYVGSVSAHERYRGQGHMKALMDMLIRDARDRGYDFLALGGQRQRYGYWDFERCGMRRVFDITRANVRHCLADREQCPIAFRPILEEDDKALPALYDLSARQEMTCLRRADRFLETMRSWNSTLYALEEKTGGAALGYLCQRDDLTVELALEQEECLPDVVRAWVEETGRMSISVPAHQSLRARALNAFAEGYTVRDSQMFRIFHWQRVLEAALALKAKTGDLAPGRAVVEIENAGKWEIRVEGKTAAVTETGLAPRLRLNARQAAALFFSPAAALETRDSVIAPWLPLPLDIPIPDEF